MSTRQKALYTILLLVCAGAISAQASIVLDGTSNDGIDLSKIWTVEGLNNPTPTASGDGNPVAIGDLTAVASLGATESFSMRFTAAMDWTAAGASDAIAGTTFGAYIGGLTATNVATRVAAFGVADASGYLNTAGEVLFVTFNTAGLTSGSLILQNLGFKGATAGDRADILLYDVSADAVNAIQWDTKPQDFTAGNYAVETGDVLAIAVGASNGENAYRFDTMTVDVIPEPATLGLISAFGAGILFIRRRFMI